jgi:hypothetical protein
MTRWDTDNQNSLIEVYHPAYRGKIFHIVFERLTNDCSNSDWRRDIGAGTGRRKRMNNLFPFSGRRFAFVDSKTIQEP